MKVTGMCIRKQGVFGVGFRREKWVIRSLKMAFFGAKMMGSFGVKFVKFE